MNIGIVLRYYKKSKFGFIKTFDKSIFFHFNERKTYIDRTDIVIFDLENSDKGLVAKNVRNIESIDGLPEKLYNDTTNEKLKWLIVEKYPEFYQKEKDLYLKAINFEEKTKDEYRNKFDNFNNYINQFASADFWKNYNIDVSAKFGSLGGRDWTEAWWNYGLESEYEIKRLDQNTTVEDNYIKSLIYYWKFIVKVEFYAAKRENVRKRKELKFTAKHLKEIKNEIKTNFDKEYSKEEHIKSLNFYYPKMEIFEKKYKEDFDKIVYNHFNKFVLNNLKDNEAIFPTRREIDEDFEWENL